MEKTNEVFVNIKTSLYQYDECLKISAPILSCIYDGVFNLK